MTCHLLLSIFYFWEHKYQVLFDTHLNNCLKSMIHGTWAYFGINQKYLSDVLDGDIFIVPIADNSRVLLLKYVFGTVTVISWKTDNLFSMASEI